MYVLLMATLNGMVKTALVHDEVYGDDPTPASYFPATFRDPEKIGMVEVDGDQLVVDMMDSVYLSE